jgi:RNA polymerase sigma-70 factor (ECF subfamily)
VGFSRSSAAEWSSPDGAIDRGVVRAPEVPSLEALFQQHATDVYRLVSRLLGPCAMRADIEDLTQQVFLAAHKALGGFRGAAKPSTWLYGIATRTVYKELRSRTRHRRMVGALENAVRSRPKPTDGSNDLDTHIDFLKVWRRLLELSPKKRVVFILHEIEGMSGQEIANLLQLPEGTVHTRLFHARRELLALMEKGR